LTSHEKQLLNLIDNEVPYGEIELCMKEGTPMRVVQKTRIHDVKNHDDLIDVLRNRLRYGNITIKTHDGSARRIVETTTYLRSK